MKKYGSSILIALLGVCLAGQAGLVVHYTFDDAASITNDASGNNKNLKVYGASASYSAEGVLGGAAVFDGTTQGFQTPTGILPAGSFTLALWMKADTWGNTSYVTKSFASGSGFQFYGAYSTELSFAALASTGATYVRPNVVAPLGQWVHVAFTYEAASGPDASGNYTGTVRGYVNGLLVVTSTNTVKYNAAVTTLMCIGRYGTGYFDGMLDDYRIYNEALTDSGVQELYISGIDPLVAHYTFDDSASIGADSSGNGHDLADYGTAPGYSAQGITNGAAIFDGSTQGLQIKSFVIGGDFTLAMWVKPDSWGTNACLLRHWAADGGFGMYAAWLPAEIAFSALAPVSADTYLRPRYTPVAGSWQHLALSFESSSGPDENGEYTGLLRAYINGELATNSVAHYRPGVSGTTTLSIGRYGEGYYDGLIDDLRIYIKALTESEIQALAAISGPLSGYAGWVGGWGVDIGAQTNDYDGDGLINLYEYAFGGDPTNALNQGTAPVCGIIDYGGTQYFGYAYSQLSDPASGLGYSLEVCTNLISGTWTNTGYEVLGTNITGGTLAVVSNYTGMADGQKFIRLVIEEMQ